MPGEADIAKDEVLEVVEIEHELLRTYGFYEDADGDPEEFLAEYVRLLKELKAENGSPWERRIE